MRGRGKKPRFVRIKKVNGVNSVTFTDVQFNDDGTYNYLVEEGDEEPDKEQEQEEDVNALGGQVGAALNSLQFMDPEDDEDLFGL